MKIKALTKAVGATLAIMAVFIGFIALVSKYPVVLLSVILALIFIAGFGILTVAFYDKYSK